MRQFGAFLRTLKTHDPSGKPIGNRWEQSNDDDDNVCYIAREFRRNAGGALPPRRHVADHARGEWLDQADNGELLGFLDAHAWVNLDIPPETHFLGDLLTTASRLFIVGATGLGKTQLAHAMGAGIASGQGFLHWRSDGPARTLIIDGEMSKSLIRSRMQSAVSRGAEIPAGNLIVFALDRAEEFSERFPEVGMFEPLNTGEGREFILRLIRWSKPDVVIFDNVMSLVTGDQKDEVPWSETLPLVQEITRMAIGQVWLDHTGHDRSRQYGSSTKAWRFDAVGIMTQAEVENDGDVSFQLSFDSPGKARARTPSNWQDFASHVITLAEDAWSSEPVAIIEKGKRVSGETRRPAGKPDLALEKLHDTIARQGFTTRNPEHIPEGVNVTTIEAWRQSVFDAGLIDADKDSARRMQFLRLKDTLLNRKAICIYLDWVWPVWPETE
jgi:hypothetical protein